MVYACLGIPPSDSPTCVCASRQDEARGEAAAAMMEGMTLATVDDREGEKGQGEKGEQKQGKKGKGGGGKKGAASQKKK